MAFNYHVLFTFVMKEFMNLEYVVSKKGKNNYNYNTVVMKIVRTIHCNYEKTMHVRNYLL